MYQSIPSTNIPPGDLRGFVLTFGTGTGFLLSELPGLSRVGPIIWYLKYLFSQLLTR